MPKKYARFLPTAESFNLEEFPYYWISQVNAQYVQNIDNVLKKYGLDNSRRRILIALNVKPHASVSELSDMIISKMSTTTKIVYRLKDEGLVETYSCQTDGRITRVVLTEKGTETPAIEIQKPIPVAPIIPQYNPLDDNGTKISALSLSSIRAKKALEENYNVFNLKITELINHQNQFNWMVISN